MEEVKEKRLTLTKVADYQKVEGKHNEVILVAENHFIRLSDGYKHLFAQNGEVYSGVGTPPLKYEEIPEWFWTLARHCNKEGRDRVGLVLPEDKLKSVELSSIEMSALEVPEKKYECQEPNCFASVPLSKKGVHIAQHALKKKRATTKKSTKKKATKVKDG